MSTLTISLIQPDLHWEDSAANLAMLEQQIMGITEKTSLILLPEMFNTGFSMRPQAFAENMEGPAVQWMKKIAAAKKSVLTGSIIAEEEGKYFNRLVWMLPNGEYGVYDKRHLFAFAGEDLHYSAGSRRLIGSLNGWKVNLTVCYDLRFPVWLRQSGPGQDAKESEYDILVVVANWPKVRSHAWKTLLQARAIENQSYVIGVNRIGKDGNGIEYNGGSLVIDPLGQIIHEMPASESVYTCTLDEEMLLETRRKFPFWKDADDFNISL